MLTARRTKPAVPFAGKYRLIDFTLSNCVNSGIFDVMLLTQYRPHSLIKHIGVGEPWDLDRSFTGGVEICQPYTARHESDWYHGTADALYQNLNIVEQTVPDNVLILSGDHVYQMDYQALIAFHAQHEADVTVATTQVAPEEASRFGVLLSDSDQRVTSFIEKPANPPGSCISMGVYIFGFDELRRALQVDAADGSSAHDFGKSIIPRLVESGKRVYAFPYTGYWVDVGTTESYWRAHMDLLQNPPRLSLYDRTWVIRTRSDEHPPAMVQKGAIVHDSLLADGSVVAAGAKVERSILSLGVYVGPKAVVRDSIILANTVINAGARVDRVIADKNVDIGHRTVVGQGKAPSGSIGLTTLGSRANIPNGIRIGRNCVIHAEVSPGDFSVRVVRRGAEIWPHGAATTGQLHT